MAILVGKLFCLDGKLSARKENNPFDVIKHFEEIFESRILIRTLVEIHPDPQP